MCVCHIYILFVNQGAGCDKSPVMMVFCKWYIVSWTYLTVQGKHSKRSLKSRRNGTFHTGWYPQDSVQLPEKSG